MVATGTRASRRHHTKVKALNLKEEALTEQYGPPPVNVITRIRQQEGLGVQAFADKIGISKHALIRSEQGTYSEMLPAILEYLRDNFFHSELYLMDEYEHYQREQRKRHHRYFGHFNDFSNTTEHPLRVLRGRLGVSPTEVSKALCLPHATLTYWEKKPKQQKTIPSGMINVLNEIGYSTQEINSLIAWYDHYRKSIGCE